MTERISRYKGMRLLLGRLFRKGRITHKMLGCAIVTGMLTGTICSFFEIIPNLLNAKRVTWLSSLDLPFGQVLLLAFAISALLAGIAIYLTRRFAPETGGSGIPEIEGALIGLRPVRFWRVLPVKFFGGLCALSSGMVLGREGPSIQLGGNIGAMLAHYCRLSSIELHVMLASGAASGLASAFNAPLAGILFVLEELRSQFKFSYASIRAVTIAVLVSTITRDCFSDVSPVLTLPTFSMVDLSDLIYFLLFGAVVGACGVGFNKSVGFMQDLYLQLHRGRLWLCVLIVATVGGCYGIISWLNPALGGSGMLQLPSWIITNLSLSMLFFVVCMRFIGIMLCFCSGIPP